MARGELTRPTRLRCAPSAAAATSATFSAAGAYALRLAATDGSAAVFQDLAVTVGGGYSAWIASHPGTGALTGALDDPDHDGIPNLAEYALGGDPTAPQAGVMPAGGQTLVEGSKYLSLTFSRARADVTYIVEGSSDLTNPSGWSEVARNPGSVGTSPTVQDAVPIGGANTKRFLRLKVAAP